MSPSSIYLLAFSTDFLKSVSPKPEIKSDSVILLSGVVKDSKLKGLCNLDSKSSRRFSASIFSSSELTKIIRCNLFFKLSKTATSSETINSASGVPIVSGGTELANLFSIYLTQSYAK